MPPTRRSPPAIALDGRRRSYRRRRPDLEPAARTVAASRRVPIRPARCKQAWRSSQRTGLAQDRHRQRARTANTQFGKLTERLDRAEKAQAEPAPSSPRSGEPRPARKPAEQAAAAPAPTSPARRAAEGPVGRRSPRAGGWSITIRAAPWSRAATARCTGRLRARTCRASARSKPSSARTARSWWRSNGIILSSPEARRPTPSSALLADRFNAIPLRAAPRAAGRRISVVAPSCNPCQIPVRRAGRTEGWDGPVSRGSRRARMLIAAALAAALVQPPPAQPPNRK